MLLLPNAWDVASARILKRPAIRRLQRRALALRIHLGTRMESGFSREEMLFIGGANCARRAPAGDCRSGSGVWHDSGSNRGYGEGRD